MHVALPKRSPGGKLPAGDACLGFLAAGLDSSLGYVGAYFVATARGRPLEFHYTTPVRPSATHRILYGAQLEPYILGELIAAKLMQQTRLEPAFVVTDQPHVLNLRPGSSCAIVCLAPEAATEANRPSANDAEPAGDAAASLLTHANHPGDRDSLRQWINQANPGLDVREPFGRIWEALREVLSDSAKLAA